MYIQYAFHTQTGTHTCIHTQAHIRSVSNHPFVLFHSSPKTLGVFEGLQNGQILCAAAVNSNVIVTAGESTVVCVWELRKEAREKGKLSMQLTKV